MSVENLKKPVKFTADFVTQYMKSKEGGFQAREIVDFLDELLQLPDVINSTEAIKQEWKDRTPASIDELIAFAIASVNLDNETDKKKVIAVLSLIGAGLKVMLAFVPAPVVTPNP